MGQELYRRPRADARRSCNGAIGREVSGHSGTLGRGLGFSFGHRATFCVGSRSLVQQRLLSISSFNKTQSRWCSGAPSAVRLTGLVVVLPFGMNSTWPLVPEWVSVLYYPYTN